jgi:chromosome segregation ATPase
VCSKLSLFFSIISHYILIVEFRNRLQNENFEESDLLRDRDSRIESLQQELRKQVEDMQEIEDLLTEKQNEIEILNNDITILQNDKQNLHQHNEELLRKIKTYDSDKSEELSALSKQIKELNEENDSNKNKIEDLTKELNDELMAANEKFNNREKENLAIIEELRKQLESQEMKLNEAMNELMSKSDENTETNLLVNEIQVLRETIVTMQTEHENAIQNHQQLVSQLNSSVNEYKVRFFFA